MDKIKRETIFLEEYKKGKSDNSISKILNCSSETVRNIRLKLNLPANKYSKIDINKVKELVDKGLTDNAISISLGVSEIGVYNVRKRNNINRKSFLEANYIEPSPFQKSVLIGTLLGDSSLIKTNINAYFVCEHSQKQRDYCFHKYDVLKSLGASYKEYNRLPDRRTNKIYKTSKVWTKSNQYLTSIYDKLYINGVKTITYDFLLNNFDETSLAYLFMDDGYFQGQSICISTNSFKNDELEVFISFLNTRFGLHFTKFSSNVLYLTTYDLSRFISLIFPNLLESMYYKINLQKIK